MKKRYFDIYVNFGGRKGGYSIFKSFDGDVIINTPEGIDDCDEPDETIIKLISSDLEDLGDIEFIQYTREIDLEEYREATGKIE